MKIGDKVIFLNGIKEFDGNPGDYLALSGTEAKIIDIDENGVLVDNINHSFYVDENDIILSLESLDDEKIEFWLDELYKNNLAISLSHIPYNYHELYGELVRREAEHYKK